MKLSTKIAAGTLTGFGLLLSGISAWLLISSATAPAPQAPAIVDGVVYSGGKQICYSNQVCSQESVVIDRGLLFILLMLGLPFIPIGVAVLRQEYIADQKQHNHLRTVFFYLLQADNGHVTPIRFAMESGLDGKLAQAYLDERAKEFNATYNVTPEGNITYYFDLNAQGGSAQLPSG